MTMRSHHHDDHPITYGEHRSEMERRDDKLRREIKLWVLVGTLGGQAAAALVATFGTHGVETAARSVAAAAHSIFS